MPTGEFPFILPPDPEDSSEDRISFHVEDIDFTHLPSSRIPSWIKLVIKNEQCELHNINIIFCSDPFLHKINLEYLKHDTLTDIITFPYSVPPKIEGDIYISVDRINDNAIQLGIPFETELHRVIIHGVLHLCGNGDKTPTEKKRMTEKENEALRQLSLM